jgi:hypothetical protein
MSEIQGYLLTKEEEKACMALIKKMREKRVYAFDFSGCVRIKAKTDEEAKNLFWEWVGDMQDKTLADWNGVVVQSPYFENEGDEEE